MKKLLILITTVLSLTGCQTAEGNKATESNRNRKWSHAHIQMNEKIIHDEVIHYYNYSSDASYIELNLKNTGWVRVSFHNCLIYSSDKCPLCNK